MRNRVRCELIALAGLLVVGCGRGANLNGDKPAAAPPLVAGVARETEGKSPLEASGESRFIAETEPAITLTLHDAADGSVRGTLSEAGEAMPLVARRSGSGFAGKVGPGGSEMQFKATEQGDHVVLDIGAGSEAQRISFNRVRAGDDAPMVPGAAGKRHVVINESRLSDEEVLRAEQTYRIQIPDANYWYDRTLGAWGGKGGPTAGFISPGLDLGGTLHADASAGTTRVFVNGRELPTSDLMALLQITGAIAPGRYFITGQGLAGYEGGPAQWNLAAMVAQSGGGGGGSNTWQGKLTGSSGFSDGTTGAVFLPNGGIVSTGQ